MPSIEEKAVSFRKLHVPGQPLVLFNIWDSGSAKAVAAAGAAAIATGSWSVASACGYSDGEHVPLELVLDNLARIVRATDCPTTVDLESGYGKTPDMVASTIERAIKAGAIGCNLEDSFPENGKLREIADQAERIRFARKAAKDAGLAFFINARSDVFFQVGVAHDEAAVAHLLERAKAYADAGADGIFAPGLADENLIAQLAAASPLPLNIMASDKTPSLASLAKAGVARLSYGPGPYIQMMKALTAGAKAAMGSNAA